MEKTITIDGTPVSFRATALTPRLYLTIFKKDMLRELMKMQDIQADDALATDAVDIFTRAGYVMAKQANDPSTDGKDYDAWLDQWSIMGIYQALPELYALWGASTITTVKSKKKVGKQLAK
jgi:hypothetical protein